MADTAKEFGVSAVRIPIQEGLKACHWLTPASQQFFHQVIAESKQAGALFREKGLRYDRWIFAFSFGEEAYQTFLFTWEESTLAIT